MNQLYLLMLLYVTVLKHASGFRVAFRFIKWNHRAIGSIGLRTIPNASLEECFEACRVDLNCKGVNYSRRRRFCEALSYDIGKYVNTTIIQQISYVFIDRMGIEVTSEDSGNVMHTVVGSDPVNEAGMREECDPFRTENGMVLGNFLALGSKIKVVCDIHHTIIDGEDILICLRNRTWSSMPSCIWDCGNPPKIKGEVNPGTTVIGSVRSYICQEDFFVSGHRSETTLNVTCMNGKGWMPEPRCVQDCDEPKNASELNAQDRTGQGVADNDRHVYICSDGFVGFYQSRHTINGTSYTEYLTSWYKITWICDGTKPIWKYSSAKCVKNCTARPSTTNVRTVKYSLDMDYNLTATYECYKGFSVYDESTSLDLGDTFKTNCSQANGKWTNHYLACRNDQTRGKASNVI